MERTDVSPMSSSYRDRTSEFRLLSETLKKIEGGTSPSVQPEIASSTSHDSYSRSEFNRKASRIGLGINETSQKVARLAQLARRSSMFNDPAVEIQELTVLIKNEITALNSALSDLQAIQNMDMADGSYSQDRIVHSTAVCDDLKSKLMGATKHLQDVLTARTEAKLATEFRFIHGQYETPCYILTAAKIIVSNMYRYVLVLNAERFKKSRGQTRLWNISGDANGPFDNAGLELAKLYLDEPELKLCCSDDNIKAHESRKQIFSKNASRENPFQHQPKPATEPPPWSNSLNAYDNLQQESVLPSNGAPVSNQLRRRLAVDNTPTQQMEMSMVQQVVPRQENYTQSRSTALHNVESTITELSGIFSHLATMVAHQGELAIRIDDNMDESLANVEGAHSSLLRHLNRISSNRWLLIKIFAVLILFLLIFIFFVA
ncbi:hypothetical protein V8G54_036979 [Vigna mungo]